jgi:hypothetical protein
MIFFTWTFVATITVVCVFTESELRRARRTYLDK